MGNEKGGWKRRDWIDAQSKDYACGEEMIWCDFFIHLMEIWL